jgi:hypothetical protein
VGKLVLFLADGSTMDVPLDKERMTIGRRADNDVCLPYPAVSGEHAAIVTILADSFLEDQGSTNGTLVNGKATAKHFLRDNDLIEIGRQRLTYVSDNDAKVEPLPPDIARGQLRGLTDTVSAVRPAPKASVGGAGARAAQGISGATLFEDLDRDVAKAPIAPAPAPVAAKLPAASSAPSSLPAANARPSEPRAASSAQAHVVTSQVPVSWSPAVPLPVADGARRDERELSAGPGGSAAQSIDAPRTGASTSASQQPSPLPLPVHRDPSVRVLSGPSTGRTVSFAKDEMTVGRAGVQVAMVRKVAYGFLLVPLEGVEPPRINGAEVPPEGSPLHPGDTFEVAGVRLELSLS